jgi:hypothetical protein
MGGGGGKVAYVKCVHVSATSHMRPHASIEVVVAGCGGKVRSFPRYWTLDSRAQLVVARPFRLFVARLITETGTCGVDRWLYGSYMLPVTTLSSASGTRNTGMLI